MVRSSALAQITTKGEAALSAAIVSGNEKELADAILFAKRYALESLATSYKEAKERMTQRLLEVSEVEVSDQI